jgi:hypothetical protein
MFKIKQIMLLHCHCLVEKSGRLHLRNTTEIRKIIYRWIAGRLSSTNNQLPAAGFATFFTCYLPALDVLTYSVSMAVFRRCSFSVQSNRHRGSNFSNVSSFSSKYEQGGMNAQLEHYRNWKNYIHINNICLDCWQSKLNE